MTALMRPKTPTAPLWLLGLLLAAGAQAQQGAPLPPMVAPAKPAFTIRGFELQGEDPLPGGESTRVLAPFLRTDATLETLQQATAALEAALQARGFALHRVVLPPQTVGETVKLQIVRFALDKVTVEGLKTGAYDEANIRASLPELQEGGSPNLKTLSVQTTIANESQGKQVQVSLKEAATPDRIDARVVVSEAKPWNFALGLANTGSQATGRDRLTVSGGHANVFGRDHEFVGAFTTSIDKGLDDVRQYGANYRIPLYAQGGVLGLGYTRSTVVGDFGALTSTGAGQTMGINYSHYLPPEGGYRSYVTLGWEDKRFDVTKIAGQPIPGQLTRRSRPLTLGYTARVSGDEAVWGYGASVSVNTGGGGGNDLGAYRSEDARITTRNFKVLRGQANYLGLLGTGGWQWSARTSVQWSPDALISGEQFGLGGASTVRGTDERPISGDSGVLAVLEVSTPMLLPGLRLHGFVDAGWLRNHDPNGNPKPARDQLASVGLGLRYAAQALTLSAEWGRIVTGSELAAFNPAAPRHGDVKFHINATWRF